VGLLIEQLVPCFEMPGDEDDDDTNQMGNDTGAFYNRFFRNNFM
jgi:hypothetical protein